MTDRSNEPVVVQQSSGDGGSGVGVGILVALAVVALVVAFLWWSGLGSGTPGDGSTNPLPSVLPSILSSALPLY